jgi:predicted small lipoprotein YifL
MVRPLHEESMSVIRCRRTSPSWLALAGALALALSVAACGRKGPLELPPSAAAEPAAAPAPVAGPPGQWDEQRAVEAGGLATVRPVARPHDPYVRNAPAAKQPSVLDWLVD